MHSPLSLWSLRIGLAFAFLYPAVSAFSEPYTWIGYIPQFVLEFGSSVGVGELPLLHAFGALEILLAFWILSGWKVWIPSFTAAAILLVIVALNPSEFPILFRDISIAAGAVSLALLSLKSEE